MDSSPPRTWADGQYHLQEALTDRLPWPVLMISTGVSGPELTLFLPIWSHPGMIPLSPDSGPTGAPFVPCEHAGDGLLEEGGPESSFLQEARPSRVNQEPSCGLR